MHSLCRASSLRSSMSCGRRRLLSTTVHPETYCANLLRERDYESFLIGYVFPKTFRPGYFALKAFSVELATVQDNVTNPLLGGMRMQFWRDAVKAATSDPPHHPVALALGKTLQTHPNISSYHLKRIIDARDAEIKTPNYLTTESLEKHAESTSSSMLYLLLQLMNITSSELDHSASHLGVAQTIVTLLRALPFHAKAGRMVIPADITAECGVVQEDVFRQGPNAQGIDDAVFKFATIANDHLTTAKEQYAGATKDLRTRALPIFLSSIPVANFLSRLERSNFDVFSSEVQRRDGWLPFNIWKGYYTGRI